MPDAPELVYEFDTSVIPGEATAIAVNDDGNIALINFADADAGSNTAWVTSTNGALWALPSSHVSSMAFLPHRNDAIVADADTQEIFLVLDLDGAGNRIPLISLNRPAGIFADVAASQDGSSLFVVSAGFPEITIVDAETHTSTVIDCSCSPTRLRRLKGNAILFSMDRPRICYMCWISPHRNPALWSSRRSRTQRHWKVQRNNEKGISVIYPLQIRRTTTRGRAASAAG